MRYMLLIYTNESQMTQVTEEEGNTIMAAYYAYGAEATAAGVYRSGEALEPASVAKTVRVRDGKALVTDGPFAETKEQLGGFYVLQCNDLDEALHWANKCPGITYAPIEIRPIVDYSE
ncbi:MAG: YciI family protein [Caldilineaceae bacterium]|nr:YciI family protein [Caldilineaceae bacterium]